MWNNSVAAGLVAQLISPSFSVSTDSCLRITLYKLNSTVNLLFLIDDHTSADGDTETPLDDIVYVPKGAESNLTYAYVDVPTYNDTVQV